MALTACMFYFCNKKFLEPFQFLCHHLIGWGSGFQILLLTYTVHSHTGNVGGVLKGVSERVG